MFGNLLLPSHIHVALDCLFKAFNAFRSGVGTHLVKNTVFRKGLALQVLFNLKQQIMLEKLHKPPNPIKWLPMVSKSADPKDGLVVSFGESTF